MITFVFDERRKLQNSLCFSMELLTTWIKSVCKRSHRYMYFLEPRPKSNSTSSLLFLIIIPLRFTIFPHFSFDLDFGTADVLTNKSLTVLYSNWQWLSPADLTWLMTTVLPWRLMVLHLAIYRKASLHLLVHVKEETILVGTIASWSFWDAVSDPCVPSLHYLDPHPYNSKKHSSLSHSDTLLQNWVCVGS